MVYPPGPTLQAIHPRPSPRSPVGCGIMAMGCLTVLVVSCACAIGMGYAGCDTTDPAPGESSGAASFVNGVFTRVREGRWAWVTGRVSSAFRGDWPPDRVQRVVGASRALSTQSAVHVGAVHYVPHDRSPSAEQCFWNALSLVATVDGTLDTADGAVAFHADLLREAGVWHLKQLTVPDGTLGGATRAGGKGRPAVTWP